MKIFEFYVKGCAISIAAHSRTDALERLERIKRDHGPALAARELACAQSGAYRILRGAIKVEQQSPLPVIANSIANEPGEYWHASFPFGFPCEGCPLGRGDSAASAIADLVRRTENESSITIEVMP